MTHVPSGNRRYLALWFPFLSADRLRIAGRCAAGPRAISSQVATSDDSEIAASKNAPLALVEKVRGAMRLMAVDRTALALGLAPGLMLADARARVPDLQVSEHDPRADQDWLERLQAGCVR